jgi:WhiB family redox-sensing transcriptional regulator
VTPAWFDSPTVACKGHTDLMFESTDKGRNGTDFAKAICNTCPHIEPCRQYALDHAIPDGIWGGQSPRERFGAVRRRGAA